MQKKIYIIGIGGIGISAIARYYNENGYQVFGSDKTDTELVKRLREEGIDVYIGERSEIFYGKINTQESFNEKKTMKNCLLTMIDSRVKHENDMIQSDINEFEKVIYTEAIPENNLELKKARELGIPTFTYPQAIGEIANDKKFITIAGSHGKSTTTSLASLLFKNAGKNFTSIVGTLLKEFGGKNYYQRKAKDEKLKTKNLEGQEEYFIIEACEYKRSFLNYKPDIVIITNIDLDHLDYYKDEEDYIFAFRQLVDNMKSGGYVILNGQEKNSSSLIGQSLDVKYIVVSNNEFTFHGQVRQIPEIELNVPGEHILYDAKLVYILGIICGIDEKTILDTFKRYTGVWRRMEVLGKTKNGNIVISDYGHHPTEIKLTLKALKSKYKGRQLLTIFQPHQYNRTIELLDDFLDSFVDSDMLVIPDIYESRDTKEDKEKMNTEIFVSKINHPNKLNGNGLENTFRFLEDFIEKNKDWIIVLMGAGSIDNFRYKIKFEIEK